MDISNKLNFRWIIEGQVGGHRAPLSEEDLVYLRSKGVKALVRLAAEDETGLSTDKIRRLGFIDLHEPVTDMTAPGLNQVEKIMRFITFSLAEGRPVAVSCHLGLGRTGTILACYLVIKGLDAEIAINKVRKKRPGSIETREQEELIKAYDIGLRTGFLPKGSPK
jgi:atypical dual specificity phosphatase